MLDQRGSNVTAVFARRSGAEAAGTGLVHNQEQLHRPLAAGFRTRLSAKPSSPRAEGRHLRTNALQPKHLILHLRTNVSHPLFSFVAAPGLLPTAAAALGNIKHEACDKRP